MVRTSKVMDVYGFIRDRSKKPEADAIGSKIDMLPNAL
jgi:hypothetical protein